jgi:hypothetical protein
MCYIEFKGNLKQFPGLSWVHPQTLVLAEQWVAPAGNGLGIP